MSQQQKSQVRPRGELPEIQHATSISGRHILRANGLTNSSEATRRYHRKRIERYGELNRDFLRSIGARFVRVKK